MMGIWNGFLVPFSTILQIVTSVVACSEIKEISCITILETEVLQKLPTRLALTSLFSYIRCSSHCPSTNGCALLMAHLATCCGAQQVYILTTLQFNKYTFYLYICNCKTTYSFPLTPRRRHVWRHVYLLPAALLAC